MQLLFATNNLNKLKEVQQILGVEILSLADVGFSGEIPEEQNTLTGNALQKAQFIFDKYHIPCFADDTGLEVAALHGNPGVYSARYAGKNCNANDNINKLLTELKNKNNRKAKFKTVIAFISEKEKIVFEGVIVGEITTSTQGKKGFGYDPIFVPDGHNKTFAQMSNELKNKISHRKLAIIQLEEYLNKKKSFNTLIQ